MAISFVNSAVNSASPNATFNVSLSGLGGAVDDLVIVAFHVGDTAASDTDISVNGFTEISDLFSGADVNDTDLYVGYRYFVAGDAQVPTSGNFTAIGGTNASNVAVVMIFRGVATVAQGGPFSTAAVTATGIDSSNADPPSIATATGDAVVIAGASGHTGGATATYTAPSGYTTNFAFRAHNDTVDGLAGMGYRLSGYANPENPGVMTAATVGTATDNSWCAVTLALKVAPITQALLDTLALAESLNTDQSAAVIDTLDLTEALVASIALTQDVDDVLDFTEIVVTDLASGQTDVLSLDELLDIVVFGGGGGPPPSVGLITAKGAVLHRNTQLLHRIGGGKQPKTFGWKVRR